MLSSGVWKKSDHCAGVGTAADPIAESVPWQEHQGDLRRAGLGADGQVPVLGDQGSCVGPVRDR